MSVPYYLYSMDTVAAYVDWQACAATPGICYLGDKPPSPILSDLAECVILCYVMVATPWKSLLPSGKHLSDAD